MPKGYIYAELDVTDPALFETYRPLATASIAEFGGHYAVRGRRSEGLGGRWSATALGAARIRQPRTRDGMVQIAAISSGLTDQAAICQDQGRNADGA